MGEFGGGWLGCLVVWWVVGWVVFGGSVHGGWCYSCGIPQSRSAHAAYVSRDVLGYVEVWDHAAYGSRDEVLK